MNSHKSKIYIFLFLFYLVTTIFGDKTLYAENAAAVPTATNQNDIAIKIQQKNDELKKINEEIINTQSKLQETQSQSKNLSTEITKIDTGIKQINLGIKASEVSIDKLNLEMTSLQQEISNSDTEIKSKEMSVTDVLKEIQQKDNEDIIMIFLKNQALSDSVFEIQALKDLYDNLNVRIEELNNSKKTKEVLLTKSSYTKNQKEYEISNLKNKKNISLELKNEKQDVLKETKNKEQNYTKYIEELTQQQIEIAQEIAGIESKLTAEINFKDLPEKLPGLFETPIDKSKTPYRISQEYGTSRWSQRVYKGGFHNGVDFSAPIGTPIVSAEDGVVVSVGDQDKYCRKGAYGKFVVIKHYFGLTTLYGHMSLYSVKEGDTIKRGQVIGYVGNTGFSTGPHLHFTIYDSSTFYIGGSKQCGPKMPFGGSINPHDYTVI